MGRLRRDYGGIWVLLALGGEEHWMAFGVALKGSAIGMLRVSLVAWL